MRGTHRHWPGSKAPACGGRVITATANLNLLLGCPRRENGKGHWKPGQAGDTGKSTGRFEGFARLVHVLLSDA